MEIRFESIKLELDRLTISLIRKVNKVQKLSKYKVQNITQIEDKMKKLKISNNIIKIYRFLNHYKFVASTNSFPNCYQIGYLNAAYILNVHKMQSSTPTVIELENILKYPTSMCTLNNEKLVITDNQQNEICILDSNMKCLKRVKQIENVKFNGPRGITTNNIDSIYICDTSNDRVVITDINFTMVKRVIGKKGKKRNEFDWPTDVCFYKDSIFVLDEINYRVQRFNIYGDFTEVVYDKKVSPVIERSNIFKKMSVDNNLIAICNRYFVYIVDFMGNELQKLGNLGVQLKSLYLNGNYLITHNTNSSIICYGLEGKSGNKEFSLVYEKTCEVFEQSTSCITKFDDKLLFSCMCNNILIVM
jgi:hypothetical protein